MEHNLKKQIFNLLQKNSQQHFDFITIAKKLKVNYSNYHLLTQMLNELKNDFLIFEDFERKYYYAQKIGQFEGILSLNPKGFGFVSVQNENDSENSEQEHKIFVPRDYVNFAISSDLVKVTKYLDLSKEQDNDFGVVEEIVQRNLEYVVGIIKYFDDHKRRVFKALNPIYNAKYQLDNIDQYHNNQVLKAKILKTQNNIIHVEPLKLLGDYNDAFVDINIEIESANVPAEFESATIVEAKAIPSTIDNDPSIGERKDLRNEIIVTIDGDDTKDFDDAINVKKLPNGNFYLGVHIADVSHYVKVNSALDNEAAERGTSIYLADRVIPMLPESLSNGICSLNPHVDRFTITLEAEIDANAQNIKTALYPSIINSYQRLTYKEVNEFYENKRTFDPQLDQMLNDARELSNILGKYKKDQGYVDLAIEESKIILDENGKTIDIAIRQQGFSENLIENFMVRANETVAQIMTAHKFPFIYRIHDKPEPEKVQYLQNVLNSLKINVQVPTNSSPLKYANAINQIRSEREDEFIKHLFLRTMQKAIYSTENIGHFGLASKHYCHFTSPIRRYPDLLVHRLIRDLLWNKQSPNEFHGLNNLAKSSSEAEKNAMTLERKVADIKKAEFFEAKVGQTFKAQIVSILKFGIFAEITGKTSVLIATHNLFPNKFTPDKNLLSISNGDITYSLGDDIEVVITDVKKADGRIDAVLAKDFKTYQELEAQRKQKLLNNRNKKPFYKKRS